MIKTPLKILIAPDKFKGSLTAKEVCEAIAAGLRQQEESLAINFHPMADGGEDSLAILAQHLGLFKETVKTLDPLGRAMSSHYFTSKEAAFIELAGASGLVLLEKTERNPMNTSTLGTGKILLEAIAKGHQNIYLFLGGSATNDGGMGIAHALGFQFLDQANQLLQPIGKNLSKVRQIKYPQEIDFEQIKITLFCDVDNPLLGEKGAALVYAPQKGANSEEVQILEEGLRSFSDLLRDQTGLEVTRIPGSGAAGGIAAALVALCGAKVEKGFEVIARLTHLEEKIQEADWVISGEGKLDKQSLQGKVVAGIAQLCEAHEKPLSLLVGKNDLDENAKRDLQIHAVFSITDLAENKEDAMRNGGKYLEALAKDFRFFRSGG